MLSAPPEPASTQPVTPSCRHIGGPSLLRPAWVWMSIRPGATILPRASIVSVASRRDVGLDRRDLAAGDRHVADRVEPDRGVDDAPALDDEVVGRRKRSWAVGKDRSTGSGRAELAPVNHESLPDVKFNLLFWIAGEAALSGRRHAPAIDGIVGPLMQRVNDRARLQACGRGTDICLQSFGTVARARSR